jgi:hypothetical protein
MDGFQKIVLIVAIVILILLLIIIGVSLKYSKNNNWPPITAECPDYWSIDGSGNNTTCTNVKDLGTCNGSVTSGNHLTMDFTVSPYTGFGSVCKKYTWANSCGLTWDGITNLSTNPCILYSTFTLT